MRVFPGNRNRDEDVLKTLCRLRDLPQDDPRIQEEYQEIQAAIELERESKSSRWTEILVPNNMRRLFIGVSLQIFQQWTGINAVVSLPAKACCKSL